MAVQFGVETKNNTEGENDSADSGAVSSFMSARNGLTVAGPDYYFFHRPHRGGQWIYDHSHFFAV